MATEWLKAAYSDILVIEKILNDPLLTHVASFHAQQAVEKSFKALLEFHKSQVPKKHDVVHLYRLVGEGIKLENEEILFRLNGLYIESRYPGDFGLLPYGKPTLEDAKEFYAFANEIFEQALKIIGIEKEKLL
jgi:HEPN domain-containing protein